MLYIFKNNNGVQIAWNSEAPRSFRNARASDNQKRSSLFGFIRTSSAG
jgi:hypothetical protein